MRGLGNAAATLPKGTWHLLVCCLLFGQLALGQKTGNQKAARGLVMADEAAIYQKNDFDSPIIAVVRKNEVYPISNKVFGAFHRIRLRDKRLGYIADTDIRLLKASEDPKKIIQQNAKEEALEARQKQNAERRVERRPPLQLTRFRGLNLSMVRYREDTMGLKPSDNMLFYGIKFSGPGLLVSGELNTEMNFLVSFSPPKYYAQATGNAAAGWIFLGDFLFQSVFPQSPRLMTYIGFGPMIRYSSFSVAVNNSLSPEGKSNYSLDDIKLGLALSTGLVLRMGSWGLRPEFKYHFEKMNYWSAGLSLQMSY